MRSVMLLRCSSDSDSRAVAFTSLMQTRRVSGKMRSEHIASLGSIDAEVSVCERLAFWAKLPERIARLANRVGSDEHAKIYGALHARIPMVTADEQRAIQEARATSDSGGQCATLGPRVSRSTRC